MTIQRIVQSVHVILVHWIVIYLVDSAIQLLNNWGLVVNMSECLLSICVHNIFHSLLQGVQQWTCVPHKMSINGSFFAEGNLFYILLLDWVQIWMRKLHHDVHVMNTELVIYDADSRCLYMQIETVSTCCWDGLNLGYKRSTLMWLSHLDIYHADGKWKTLIFFSLFLYTRITYFNPDTSHKLAILYADGKLCNI